MNSILFSPVTDSALTFVALCLFVANFVLWARRDDGNLGVSLKPRLKTAVFRILLLLATILICCWACNLAVWFVFAVSLLSGIIGNIAVGQIDSIFGLTPNFVREWCFGFPQFILHPQADTNNKLVAEEIHVGMIGRTTTPLRPSGHVLFNGKSYSVTSESGLFVDRETEVEIVAFSKERIRVCTLPQKNTD